MRLFQSVVFRLSKLAAWLSAGLLIAMLLHILVEIALRSFFDTSTFVLDEFVGYGVAAVTFLTLGYALEQGSLIRVNILLTRLRHKPRQILEILSAVMTLAMSCYIAWYFWRGVKRNWDRGAVSESIAEVPLWIPEGLVFLGLVLFTLQLFAYLLRLLTGAKPIASGSNE